MIRNLIYFLVSHFLVVFISCQNDFDNYMSIDFSLLDKANTTTSAKNNEDLGKCQCDLTENTCDYLCCCDNDCPSSTISLWLNTTNSCTNIVSKLTNYKTICFNNNLLYSYNRKRGMNEFNIAQKNLFCVNIDDSSIMDQFYQIVHSLTNSTLTSYVSTISNASWNSFTNNISLFMTFPPRYSYLWGNEIGMYNMTPTTSHDIIYFIKNTGPYGECINNGILKFWNNIPSFTCKNKINLKNDCLKNSWENEILIRISSNPSGTAWIGVVISNFFIKDMQTGKVSDITGNYQFSTNSTNNITCTCNGLLLESHISAIIDPTSLLLLYFYADIVIADSVTASCSDTYEYENKYSYTFVLNKDDRIKSGNPGYIIGKPLLIANLINGYFLLKKYGFYINARDTNGLCVSSNLYLNSFEYSIKFGESSLYTCQKRFKDINEFSNFCTFQQWKDLQLYSNIQNIQYLGIMGNADPSNPNDWLKVLNDYNFSNSTFVNNNCNFPNNIVLDILYSRAGIKVNPQKYIVSAKISSINNIVSYNPTIELRLIINFVDIDMELFNKPLPAPSILPRLPSDIAEPLLKG